MEEASRQGGRFDLRKSPAGVAWNKAIASDEALKNAYAAIGRGYQEQRRFRDDWATMGLGGGVGRIPNVQEETGAVPNKVLALAMIFRRMGLHSPHVSPQVKAQLEVERSKRRQREQLDVSTNMGGVYMAPSKIRKEEGEDEAGLAATIAYIEEALSRHSRGGSFNGHPWVAFNAFTKRYEFLNVTRSVNERFTQSFIAEVAEADKRPISAVSGVPGGAGGEGAAPSGKRRKEKDEEPVSAKEADKRTKELAKKKDCLELGSAQGFSGGF